MDVLLPPLPSKNAQAKDATIVPVNHLSSPSPPPSLSRSSTATTKSSSRPPLVPPSSTIHHHQHALSTFSLTSTPPPPAATMTKSTSPPPTPPTTKTHSNNPSNLPPPPPPPIPARICGDFVKVIDLTTRADDALQDEDEEQEFDWLEPGSASHHASLVSSSHSSSKKRHLTIRGGGWEDPFDKAQRISRVLRWFVRKCCWIAKEEEQKQQQRNEYEKEERHKQGIATGLASGAGKNGGGGGGGGLAHTPGWVSVSLVGGVVDVMDVWRLLLLPQERSESPVSMRKSGKKIRLQVQRLVLAGCKFVCSCDQEYPMFLARMSRKEATLVGTTTSLSHLAVTENIEPFTDEQLKKAGIVSVKVNAKNAAGTVERRVGERLKDSRSSVSKKVVVPSTSLSFSTALTFLSPPPPVASPPPAVATPPSPHQDVNFCEYLSNNKQNNNDNSNTYTEMGSSSTLLPSSRVSVAAAVAGGSNDGSLLPLRDNSWENESQVSLKGSSRFETSASMPQLTTATTTITRGESQATIGDDDHGPQDGFSTRQDVADIRNDSEESKIDEFDGTETEIRENILFNGLRNSASDTDNEKDEDVLVEAPLQDSQTNYIPFVDRNSSPQQPVTTVTAQRNEEGREGKEEEEEEGEKQQQHQRQYKFMEIDDTLTFLQSVIVNSPYLESLILSSPSESRWMGKAFEKVIIERNDNDEVISFQKSGNVPLQRLRSVHCSGCGARVRDTHVIELLIEQCEKSLETGEVEAERTVI